MSKRGFLGQHPQLYRKKITQSPQQRLSTPLEESKKEEMTEELIGEERSKIYDLQMRIKAYEIKIKQQQSIKLDHSQQIQALEEDVKRCREEEAHILQQIQNCRKVENQVSPMEYYLWKKKQRINTYDASIAELCKDVEEQRQCLERSIDQHRHLNQEMYAEIEELEERIANFNASPKEPESPIEMQEEQFGQLFMQNITLKQEHSAMAATNSILQQNRQIVGTQVVDNIDSIVSTLKSYFQDEKTRLVRQFKQIQAESRNIEVSPLTREEQSYNIEPLINDYHHKMAELLSATPEDVRKYIQPILQPLPWKSFNWNQFLEMNNNGESVYDQYTRLQKEVISIHTETQNLQTELRKISSEIANEQQRQNEILMNISKLKKKLNS